MDEPARNRRRATLGLLGLALAGGLYLVLRSAGGIPGGGAGERFVVDYEVARDLTGADRTVPLGEGWTAAVQVTPRPLRAMARLRFHVTLRAGAAPLAADDVELAFNMEMDMGRHVYRLLRDGAGWRAEVVLPACSWGGERWFARLRVRSGGERREAVLLFELPRGAGNER